MPNPPVIATPGHEALRQAVAHAVNDLGYPAKSLTCDDVGLTTIYDLLAGKRSKITLDSAAEIFRRLPLEAQLLVAHDLFPELEHDMKGEALAVDGRKPALVAAVDTLIRSGRSHQEAMERMHLAAVDGKVSMAERTAVLAALDEHEQAIQRTRDLFASAPVVRLANTGS